MRSLQSSCKIIANKKICPRFYKLSFDSPVIRSKARPGQFIHIRVNDGLEPFFRRPFSIHRAKKHIEIFYEVVGKGTKRLSDKKPGEMLDVMGPLGNEFDLPPEGTKQVVMVAGGIGVAPFLILSDILKKENYDTVLLYGGKTKGHTFKMDDYRKNGCKVCVSTDDGSVGVKGRVSKLFAKIKKDSQTTFLYLCGPQPMMRSVQDFAKKHGLKGQASLEAVMACGLGACLGCSKKTTSGYKTVCYDGPVFDLHEIIL